MMFEWEDPYHIPIPRAIEVKLKALVLIGVPENRAKQHPVTGKKGHYENWRNL